MSKGINGKQCVFEGLSSHPSTRKKPIFVRESIDGCRGGITSKPTRILILWLFNRFRNCIHLSKAVFAFAAKPRQLNILQFFLLHYIVRYLYNNYAIYPKRILVDALLLFVSWVLCVSTIDVTTVCDKKHLKVICMQISPQPSVATQITVKNHCIKMTQFDCWSS